MIFNAVFTGDAERHEAEIRKGWDGPLCVVARDVPTARKLGRVRKEVEAGLAGIVARPRSGHRATLLRQRRRSQEAGRPSSQRLD